MTTQKSYFHLKLTLLRSIGFTAEYFVYLFTYTLLMGIRCSSFFNSYVWLLIIYTIQLPHFYMRTEESTLALTKIYKILSDQTICYVNELFLYRSHCIQFEIAIFRSQSCITKILNWHCCFSKVQSLSVRNILLFSSSYSSKNKSLQCSKSVISRLKRQQISRPETTIFALLSSSNDSEQVIRFHTFHTFHTFHAAAKKS